MYSVGRERGMGLGGYGRSGVGGNKGKERGKIGYLGRGCWKMLSASSGVRKG